MNYAVIDADGAIKRVGVCSARDFSLQGKEGQTVIEVAGGISGVTHRYIDGEFIEVEQPTENLARQMRNQRGHLLKASDWTQMADSPLSDGGKQAYRDYRQALRNITNHANWPNLTDQDWPTLEI